MKRVTAILAATCLASAAISSFADMNEQKASSATETAVFGGGCFWCLDAQFKLVPGVKNVFSGYVGVTMDNPN
jgi:hypothetical protein